jgi:hypothetical protein
MTSNTNDQKPRGVADDMIADLGMNDAESARLRQLLDDVAGLANEVPEPSDGVRAMLAGAAPLRPRRRAGLIVAAASAVALSGVSVAAAANRLPDPVQEVVADATQPLPFKAPHPVKPVKPANPPLDAPGHVKDEPKPTKTPKPINTAAPGQIQKLTKPDPNAPGPARPADPGSHGRLHHETKVNGNDADDADDDKAKPEKEKLDKPAGGETGKGKTD